MVRTSETRDKVVEVALRLFRDEGFHATTMRRIADEAGVSLGNAYYYFAGKDELVHELYMVIQRDHRDRALRVLVDGGSLSDNLAAVLHSGVDVMAPYHAFGGTFLQLALPTRSSSSPFSEESSDARSMAIDLMRATLAASKQKVPASLNDSLPTLLWMIYLGVTLHWVTDSSENQVRTRTLIDGLVPVVAKAVRLVRLPVARGLVADVAGLMKRMTSEEGLRP
ncbi:MAG: TetR family transcriptional regulator [Rhodococcus sp. (in: high G+C Gram-positive bacteria)]|uniref:TetR/AcrR family transcriptional regulator n=1 Tax=Rhodococcus sp. EPR-157 TaxID=1813677 RepID=UPI0007BC20BC|nr:TetR family transcriptional regulator [Rhodococcus sp. EPR-157]KZF09369.1 TetR family transcriptional regulator [Rhodococcus sp. EPR-157]